MDSSIDWKSKQKENVPVVTRCKDLESNCDENTLKQDTKDGSKNFVFGPFTPVGMPTKGDSGKKIVSRIQDLENLASSYYPHYHNEGTFLDFI